jgi:hypothetical protein
VQAVIREMQKSINPYLVDLINTSMEGFDFTQEVDSDPVIKDKPEIILQQVELLWFSTFDSRKVCMRWAAFEEHRDNATTYFTSFENLTSDFVFYSTIEFGLLDCCFYFNGRELSSPIEAYTRS